jgi:hypothetical protein
MALKLYRRDKEDDRPSFELHECIHCIEFSRNIYYISSPYPVMVQAENRWDNLYLVGLFEKSFIK